MYVKQLWKWKTNLICKIKPNMKNLVILAVTAILMAACGNSGKTTDYSLIPVSNDGEKWGYINSKGEYVINE